jgi:ubiquinone biosynthesis protein UbiJ
MDVAASLANRVFERQAWAQQRLAEHAGRTFVLAVGPFASAFVVEATGRFGGAPLAGSTPDLRLTLSPLALPSFLAQPARWDEFVTAEGDAALASTLKELAQTLPWFVEQTFASALGPIVGQRVADAGRRLLAFPEYAAERVGASVASYARDEADLVVGGSEWPAFIAATTDLVARTDALGARIEALAQRLASTPRAPSRAPRAVPKSTP